VVNYNGDAKGGLAIKSSQAYVNGVVDKDLSVTAREITLGSGTLVKGNVDYYSPKEMIIEQGATIRGTVNFHKTKMPAKGNAQSFILGLFTLGVFLKTIMFITAALVILYLAKNHVKPVVAEASSRFWQEVLRGFVVLVAVPVAIIISLFTVIGIVLGMVALFAYLALLVGAAVISALLFARLALKHVFKKENYELNWWLVIVAVLVLGLVNLIPFIGWLFTFVIFLASLGSLANYVYKRFK
jgi:hypothetical protein